MVRIGHLCPDPTTQFLGMIPAAAGSGDPWGAAAARGGVMTDGLVLVLAWAQFLALVTGLLVVVLRKGGPR